MLDARSTITSMHREVVEDDLRSAIGIKEIWAFLFRNGKYMAVFAIAGAIIGIIYALLAAPVYVASSRILLSRPDMRYQTSQTSLVDVAPGTSELESQIQVIQSELIARAVVAGLGLQNDPYMRANSSMLSRFRRRSAKEAGPPDQNRGDHSNPNPLPISQVLSTLEAHIGARRIGESSVLEISYSSNSPIEAAKIVNSVTAAYIRDQLLRRKQILQSGDELLAKRVLGLNMQLQIADAAIKSGKIDVDTFPYDQASVITSAAVPSGKSWPKTDLMLALGGLVGLVIGFFAAAIRQQREIAR